MAAWTHFPENQVEVHGFSHLACHPLPQLYPPHLTVALGASEERPAQDKGAFHTPRALHQPIGSRHVLSGDRRGEGQ